MVAKLASIVEVAAKLATKSILEYVLGMFSQRKKMEVWVSGADGLPTQ